MRRWSRQFVVAICLALLVPGAAFAEWQQSTSYGMNESEIGGNGQFNSFSTNYSTVPGVDDSGLSLGESIVGNSGSANYQINSGFNTTAQPGLTLLVNSGAVNLGLLSTATKSTGTATFDVINYTSYGYAVTLIGTPPTYGGHALTALSTDTASSAGTEQFGVNAVNNTSAGVGADPQQRPSSSFSYGVAGDGVTGTYGSSRPYTISDKWRYVSGETVASAPKSSGDTRFTLTFLANQSTGTPSGTYAAGLDLVVTGTY
jgi:hypothetical protein